MNVGHRCISKKCRTSIDFSNRRLPVEKWDLVNDVILKGTFLITKHTLPSMQKQNKGQIITFPPLTEEHQMRINRLIVLLNCQVGFTKADSTRKRNKRYYM